MIKSLIGTAKSQVAEQPCTILQHFFGDGATWQVSAKQQPLDNITFPGKATVLSGPAVCAVWSPCMLREFVVTQDLPKDSV